MKDEQYTGPKILKPKAKVASELGGKWGAVPRLLGPDERLIEQGRSCSLSAGTQAGAPTAVAWTKYDRPFESMAGERLMDLLASGTAGVCIDVSTPREFKASGVPGRINIPFFLEDDTGALAANPRFVSQLKNAVPEGATLLLGCPTGERASSARVTLLAAGIHDIRAVEFAPVVSPPPPTGCTVYRRTCPSCAAFVRCPPIRRPLARGPVAGVTRRSAVRLAGWRRG